MDLTRPPWDLTVIDGVHGLGAGLPARAAVIVLRVHHSIGDGVATAAILRRMLSESPETQEEPAAQKPRSAAWAPIGFAQYLGATLRAPRLARAMAQAGDIQPPTPTATRFSGAIEGHTALSVVYFDLAEISETRKAVDGATLNDVVVSVIAGALGRLLADLDSPVDRALLATMPIAVDAGAEARARPENKFALGSIALPVHESDPVERLRLVHESTRAEKERQRQPAFIRYRNLPNSIPAYVTRINGRQAAKASGTKPGPVTMVSNVPSHLKGATFLGTPVVAAVGFLTIHDGGTLAHFVTSLGNRVALGVTVDDAALPEPAVYEQLLRAAFDELLTAARSVAGQA